MPKVDVDKVHRERFEKKNRRTVDDKFEYWNVQCRHCRGYERIAFITVPAMFRVKWPILRCRCEMFFSFLESSLLIFLNTGKERKPDSHWLARCYVIRAENDIDRGLPFNF